MKTINLIVILLVLPFFSAFADVYKLEGMIGGKYPVVIELEEFDDELFSGWYAYKSTLRNKGDIDCSWLRINPSYDNHYTEWDISDCRYIPAETWTNVNFDDHKHLKARMKNVQGKEYDVSGTVVKQYKSDASLTQYFKQHICEMACDFDMFNDIRVKFRLINIMGLNSYFALKEIYQTQGDFEYSKGMFWGSGFMARQCCDPAAVWAYDTYNDSFYVWIRKDGRDYWWSESGDILIKFRELVDSRF